MYKLGVLFIFFAAVMFSCSKNEPAEVVEESVNSDLNAALEKNKQQFATVNQNSRWVLADPSLRMRDIPGLDGKQVALIPYASSVSLIEEVDEEVLIGGVSGKWSKVSWEDEVGWVFGAYLSGDKAPENSIKTIAYIKDDNIWLIDSNIKNRKAVTDTDFSKYEYTKLKWKSRTELTYARFNRIKGFTEIFSYKPPFNRTDLIHRIENAVIYQDSGAMEWSHRGDFLVYLKYDEKKNGSSFVLLSGNKEIVLNSFNESGRRNSLLVDYGIYISPNDEYIITLTANKKACAVFNRRGQKIRDISYTAASPMFISNDRFYFLLRDSNISNGMYESSVFDEGYELVRLFDENFNPVSAEISKDKNEILYWQLEGPSIFNYLIKDNSTMKVKDHLIFPEWLDSDTCIAEVAYEDVNDAFTGLEFHNVIALMELGPSQTYTTLDSASSFAVAP